MTLRKKKNPTKICSEGIMWCDIPPNWQCKFDTSFERFETEFLKKRKESCVPCFEWGRTGLDHKGQDCGGLRRWLGISSSTSHHHCLMLLPPSPNGLPFSSVSPKATTAIFAWFSPSEPQHSPLIQVPQKLLQAYKKGTWIMF